MTTFADQLTAEFNKNLTPTAKKLNDILCKIEIRGVWTSRKALNRVTKAVNVAGITQDQIAGIVDSFDKASTAAIDYYKSIRDLGQCNEEMYQYTSNFCAGVGGDIADLNLFASK